MVEGVMTLAVLKAFLLIRVAARSYQKLAPQRASASFSQALLRALAGTAPPIIPRTTGGESCPSEPAQDAPETNHGIFPAPDRSA